MPLAARQKDDQIKIKQYITNSHGRKVGAVVDLKELARVNDLLQDLLDLKAIEDRASEPSSDYEAYSRRRRARR